MYREDAVSPDPRRGRLARLIAYSFVALACSVVAPWIASPNPPPAVAATSTPSSQPASSLALSVAPSGYSYSAFGLPSLPPLSTSPSLFLSLGLSSPLPLEEPSPSPSPSPSPTSSSPASDPLPGSFPEVAASLRLAAGLVIFLLAALLARSFGPEWRP